MARAFYIDRLRILLTMLVVFHHSAIAFGASGGWYYVTSEATSGTVQMILSLFMGINQAYFMSFFFFISALLMPTSFDKKGFGTFVKDRLVRLGIPLAVYVTLIHPTLVFGIFKYLDKPTGSWLNFVWEIVTKYTESGPMWFVFTLLIFELVYSLYQRYLKGFIRISDKLPSNWGIVGFLVVTGGIAFGIRMVYPTGKNFFGLQFGYFTLYIAMYFIGIVANRRSWLERLTLRKAMPWFVVSLLSIPILVAALALSSSQEAMSNFSGGMNLRAFVYAMWEPIICVGFCYFLLMFFKKYLNQPSKRLVALSADSYTAYIIHSSIVVGATFLSEQLLWPPLARLGFVLILSIPACFLVGHFIRRIPGVKRVL